MKNLTTIGRIIFAIPFLIIGINHFIMRDVFVGMLTSFIPGGAYTILLTGVVLILAAISLIINKYVRFTCFTLAFLLLTFILTIHIPNLFKQESQVIPMINLLKDFGLMGGALIIASIYPKD